MVLERLFGKGREVLSSAFFDKGREECFHEGVRVGVAFAKLDQDFRAPTFGPPKPDSMLAESIRSIRSEFQVSKCIKPADKESGLMELDTIMRLVGEGKRDEARKRLAIY